MKISSIKRKYLIAGAIIMIISNPGFAETTASSPEYLELHKIMHDMGVNMHTITDAITREDWELVEKASLEIVDHPKPSLGERGRIMAFIGIEMGRFKGYDEKTHEAAKILNKSASSKDGSAVITDFATLQQTCLMCHQSFRKPFQEHFYGESLGVSP